MAAILLDNFFDRLRIASYDFHLGENLTSSQTGAGEILTAETGPRLWRGSVSLASMSHDDARAQAALVNRVMNAAESFQILDKRRQYPLRYSRSAWFNDANGTWWSPALESIAGRTFSFVSRKPGLIISPGDLVSYETQEGFGTNRRLLAEVAEEVVTPDDGETFTIRMTAAHRGSASSLVSASFVRPFCLAKIVPGSVSPFRRNLDHASGLSFDFVQSVKVF